MLHFTENISDLPKVTHRACQTQIIGSEGVCECVEPCFQGAVRHAGKEIRVKVLWPGC